ncbi:MAG: radical SAM protein [Desulfobacterales bacterium]|nr:radical SAM protein [Desulfobacterales bacterium]
MRDDHLMAEARRIAWARNGRAITFFLPGMFILDRVPGRYPAVSITGNRCALMCDHCRATLLAPMIAAESPEALVARCREIEREGHPGVLVSGGCDGDGCLPWGPFLPALSEVKRTTRLHVSVHAGFIRTSDALGLKGAGVDQALVDVIGDDGTLRRVYHVPFGVERVASALAALRAAGVPVVPHIVCGLDGGRMVGEERALELVARFGLEQLVVVAFMGLPGTPLHRAGPPAPEAVAGLIARARLRLPDLTISLGCASHDQPRLRAAARRKPARRARRGRRGRPPGAALGRGDRTRPAPRARHPLPALLLLRAGALGGGKLDRRAGRRGWQAAPTGAEI